MKSKNPKIQILKREITAFLAVMFITTPIMTATSLSINTNTAETNTIQSISTENSKSVLGFDLNELLYGKVGLAVNEINKKLEAGETIIEISNEIQLRALAEIVNNEKNGLKNITIVVTDDIIINSDEEWIPIGTQETPFEGCFVGGKIDEESNLDTSIERCISNLKFTKAEKKYEELTNIGLFGVIGDVGLIQNIVIDNFNIDILYESIEESMNLYYYNAGNIAGINKGTIKDCVNYSDIKGGTCVGGIVGYNEGKISNCINAGIIMGYDNTDGIAGQNIGKIENCYDINDMSDEEAGISLLSMGDDPYIETTKNENEIDITELFPKTKKEKDIEPVNAEKTTVKYKLAKDGSEIKEKTYLTYHKNDNGNGGFGDKLYVTLTYDRCFENNKYPSLKMLDSDGNELKKYFSIYGSATVNKEKNTTTITYVYNVKDEEYFEIDKLAVGDCKGIEATRTTKNEKETTTETAVGADKVQAVIPVEIIVDSIAPKLQSVKAYVDEKLETSRYTAEKEVLFELTINKVIDDIRTDKPDIEVSFSKSGRGLYNYSTDKKKAGFAKYRSDLTRENEDGTYTMVYSYKIQEGDEGILSMGVSGFTLIDLAGNTTKVDQNTNIVEIKDNWIDIDEKKIEDMDISYRVLNSNGGEITQRTTFKKGQSFSIEFTFDKILYAIIGKNNADEDVTSLLSKYPEYAPNLLLNNIISATPTPKVVINEAEGTTKITYNYSISNILTRLGILSEEYLENATIISSIGLCNANGSLGEQIDYIGGSTPYCEKIYKTTEACIEHKDEFKYIHAKAYKIMGLDFNLVIDPEGDVTYDIDDIYADTTSPTLKITTDTTDPTNASEITYTFEFSESVRDFAEEDITVNGGTIVKGTFARLEGDSKLGEEYGKKYQIKVKPLISDGEEGILQVIVEKGACVDQVAKENVRQESNIKIDKVKPVFESYSIKEEGSKIVAEFIYNEALKNGEIALRMTIGGKPITLVRDIEVAESEDANNYNYTLKIDENNPNKVIYTYYKDPADGGKVEAEFTINYVSDLAGNISESKTVKLEDEIILEQTVVKSETEENVYYTFKKNRVDINSFSQPTYFKAGDTITVVKHEEIEVENEGKKEKQYKTTNYEYTITEEDVKKIQSNSNPVQISNIALTEPPKKDSNGSLEIASSSSNDSINITEANIYFDVVAPEVELSVKVNEPNINNVYTKGEELIITATTNEGIQETEAPKIRVSFTNSGIGKYNDSNAKYQETITNENGTTTWVYKYIAQDGDDGKTIIEYATEKTVSDLAGNAKTLKTYPAVNKGDINLTDIEIGESTKVSFEIYKNNEKIENFTNNTYFANGDCIRVVAKFDKLIYGAYNDDERNLLNKNTAPTLKMNDKTFEVEEELINNKSIAKIEHDKEEYKTTVTYIYEVKAEDKETQLTNLSLSSSDKLVALHKELKEPEETEKAEKTEEKEPEEITVTKEIKVNISKDITNCNLHIYNSSTIVSGKEITVDTIKPKVNIKAQYEVTTEEGEITYNTIVGPTNLEKILYTFEFSEEIEGFDIDDIIVNGGTKGTLQEETSGKVYKLEITPNVADGNEGNVQVIVEKDSCTDKAGFGNIRAENNVKVDRKAPTLLGLEAYAPTDSNIKLNEEINIEQEYYKATATLKIVATFDESVTTEAKLSLQFGKEKAKGEVKQEGTTGNKITYTYKIVDGDEGKLSVASYRGKALDAAGNEITVTKRELSGDTIIADTTSPKLKELKVVSPGPEITENEKTETDKTKTEKTENDSSETEEQEVNNNYKAGNKVKIEAIFDEEIYVLEENEIKLIDTHIEVKNEEETEEGEEPEVTITNNAPTLIIKFGTGEEREAIVEGYGTKEDGSIDKTKIIYTYTIVEEHIETEIQEIDGEEKEVEILCSGDNGELKVVSFKNKENVEVCDLAGNTAILTNNLTGNKIIADTIAPTVEDVWAEVKESTVGNTGIYHKAGNIATIYVQFSEKIEAVNEKIKSIIYVFDKPVECDEVLEDGLTAKFTYEIQDGDNGYLRVKVPGSQFKDMAGNENVQEYEDEEKKIEKYRYCKDVYADTQTPYLSTNKGDNSQWKIEYLTNNYNQVYAIEVIGKFNEKIYSMNDNNEIGKLTKAPRVEIFIGGKAQNQLKDPEIYHSGDEENGYTVLYYYIDAYNIDTTEKPTLNFIDGTVYDRAGNKMSLEAENFGDITSPIFQDIKIVTPNGFYKSGDEIVIIARFREETRLANVPTLRVKLGDKIFNLTGSFDSDNEENTDTIKVAKYTYTVVDKDNGALNIISLLGTVSDGTRGRTVEKYFLDEVIEDENVPEDENGEGNSEENSEVNGENGEGNSEGNNTEPTSKVNTEPEELLNSLENAYANNDEEFENVIADTIKPYITKVEAKVDNNVIASYKKEDGEDAVVELGRTNASEMKYVITFSEPVTIEGFSEIGDTMLLGSAFMYNGLIGEIKALEYSFNNEYTIAYFKKLEVTVNPTTEGVQSLMIPSNIFMDRAKNKMDAERFNIVTTDFTKPTIRFVSEYNGGTYVLPTNIGKVEVRPNVEISEDIAKIEYKWDDGEYSEINNYSTSSDIAIPTKAFTEVGTHTLYIRVIDLAGNISETSKVYNIISSNIDITLSTEEWTNEDLTVTVKFGEGLTDNRKVTFKAESASETVEINAIGTDENENTQYTITENGTMYVEATDKVGNKVFTERTITNIDKEAPTVEIDLNSADLVIGTGKEKATIKTNVAVEDNKALNQAKFAYIQEDIDIDNMTDEQKEKINTNLNGEAKIENAESTKDKTPYYLYVIATDEAGNETIEKAGPFTVYNTNVTYKVIEPEEPMDPTEPVDPSEQPSEENPAEQPAEQAEEPSEEPTEAPSGEPNPGETEEPAEPEIIEIPPEIEASKLIAFEKEGKRFNITFNNFEDGEEYLDIIKGRRITLTNEEDGEIYNSWVYINKPTTITVTGIDACGNEVIVTRVVTEEELDGPEFEVYGNSEDWTNQNIRLDVYCYEELSSLTVNGTNITENMYYIVETNGEYKFIATDIYGMTSEKTIIVEKIDKDNPKITKLETEGNTITMTAEDISSGVERYAITDTTEVPLEWSDSKEIKVTHDGAFYAWVMDKAGNISRSEGIVTVDTTAPTVTFNYTLLTVEAGLPIEANIITNEEAIIKYSWDNENWIISNEYITNIRVTKKYDITGTYTLYAKAMDKYGNESKVQTIEFTVTRPDEDVVDPQIEFTDLYVTKIDGVNYVKIPAGMTLEEVNNKMEQEKLYELTPEYKNLTEDGDLKTGSEITLNGDTKYIVIVNGDVNCDGKIDFLGDIITANNYRIGITTLSTMQKLAADIDNDGKIEFISDILAINNYRIGVTNSL